MLVVPLVPRLVLIVGHSGVGKSRFSRNLQPMFGEGECKYIDTDRVKMAFGKPDSFAEPSQRRDTVYSKIEEMAFSHLREGKHVILDAPYTYQLENPMWVEQLEQRLVTNGVTAEPLLIWLTASEATIIRNQEQRNAYRDCVKLADMERAKAERQRYKDNMRNHQFLEVRYPDYQRLGLLPLVYEYICSDKETREAWRKLQSEQTRTGLKELLSRLATA